MKTLKRLITILILLALYNPILSQETVVYMKAKVFLDKSNTLQKLGSLGIPADDGYIKPGEYIISDYSEREIQILNENGFATEILINDIKTYYKERNSEFTGKDPDVVLKANRATACSGEKYATPQYFGLGSMGGYYTLEEVLAEMDSIHARFPNLASSKATVGTMTSIEGRNLYYIKLSDNPDVDENEPEVLYSALTHAREPAGMQQLFFYIYWLLENYGTDPTATYILDNTELYIVPVVNVDGYFLNETTDPAGGGMHRKNCRITGGSPIGVDLNRNYGYAWGYDNSGSSPNIDDETYRGTSGFSEPETQIMKLFCESREFVTAIDYHCYSNLLIIPYSYEYDLFTPDSLIYNALSPLMTEYNGFLWGTPNQTVGYTGNGGSIDWFYGEQATKGKILAWSPEAGDANDGFWPQISRIEEVCRTNIEANLYVALFAGRYAEVRSNASRFISGNGYVPFSIQRLGTDTSGYFQVELVPVNPADFTAGPPVSIMGLSLLEIKTDSMSISLGTGLSPGQEIKYRFRVSNGIGEYFTDTLYMIYGNPVEMLDDPCSNLSHWTTTYWGTTTGKYHSAPSSITDSPSGNYSNNTARTITLNTNYDLTNATFAELNFWTRWDIQSGVDYAEVLVSTNNGSSWTPACGTLSKAGNSSQTNGTPVYDGYIGTWTEEHVNLNDFLGSEIKIRFRLYADPTLWYFNDGFYFDDLKILIINDPSGSEEQFREMSLNVYPVPAGDDLVVETTGFVPQELVIRDITGRIVQISATGGNQLTVINTENLANGMYLLEINSKELKKVVNFVIQH